MSVPKALVLSLFIAGGGVLFYYLWKRKPRRTRDDFFRQAKRRLNRNRTASRFVEEAKEGIVRLQQCELNVLPQVLTRCEAECLVTLLCNSGDIETIDRVAITIGNLAAFTQNQNIFREVGCLEALTNMLHEFTSNQDVTYVVQCPGTVENVVNAVNNLALNTSNQPDLRDCIPPLMDLAKCDNECIQLAALRALTNLSIEPDYHPPYTQLVQNLYKKMDMGPTSVRMQALKLLVNLSCNEKMVPHLLAAKAPKQTLNFLSGHIDAEVLLRWCVVLANILATAKSRALTAAALPPEHKAPSPETMFTALFGLGNRDKLQAAVFVLCRHLHPEVSQQAQRMYNALQ